MTKQTMYKGIFYTIMACMIGTCFVQQSYAASKVNTITPGVLTIGSDLTYPPYDFLKDGKAVGFEPTFMRALARQMGLKVKYVDTRFAQLIIGLRAHRFDVVASILYVTRKRAKVIDYVPYMSTGDSIMVRADSKFEPRTPKDLCGKTVSNIKGASWIPKLNKVSKEYCLPAGKPAIRIKSFPTAPGASQALLSGNVDVQFADAAIAKLTVKKTGNQLKITSDKLLYPIAVGIGLTASNDQLRHAIERAIEKMKESGEYQKLLAQYNMRPLNQAKVQKVLADTQ